MRAILLLCLPWPVILAVLAWPWLRDLWDYTRYQWLSASDGHHIDDIENRERGES